MLMYFHYLFNVLPVPFPLSHVSLVNVHFSANPPGTPIYRAFPDYENFS